MAASRARAWMGVILRRKLAMSLSASALLAGWLLLNGKSPFGSIGGHSALKALPGAERARVFLAHRGELPRLRLALRAAVDAARAEPAFAAGAADRPLSPSERAAALACWQRVIDAMVAIDRVKALHADFWRFPWPPDLANHGPAFSLAYGAYAAQLSCGADLIRLAANRKALETLLDEPSEELGIPKGSFARLKWGVLHLQDIAQLYSGRGYLELIQKAARTQGGWEAWEPVWAASEEDFRAARGFLKAEGASQVAANALDIARTASFKAWFPVQKGVAEWMGDTRIAHGHRFLVTDAQIEALKTRLAPGDVLIERRNWYLSNVGLPGFWPHAALFVGTPEELDLLSADPGVQAWLSSQAEGTTSLAMLLSERFPQAFGDLAARDAAGHPRRVLEAMSEGVVFTTLEHSADADYLAALRPRLSPLDKARAIVEAFRHAGKPYDFDFDFRSDAAIVCSELVFKAYQPDAGAGRAGVPWDLVDLAGRKVLPPNLIVRRFDETFGTGAQCLDLVCFLDGREKERTAVEGTVESFRASHKRPKWDLLQE